MQKLERGWVGVLHFKRPYKGTITLESSYLPHTKPGRFRNLDTVWKDAVVSVGLGVLFGCKQLAHSLSRNVSTFQASLTLAQGRSDY